MPQIIFCVKCNKHGQHDQMNKQIQVSESLKRDCPIEIQHHNEKLEYSLQFKPLLTKSNVGSGDFRQ